MKLVPAVCASIVLLTTGAAVAAPGAAPAKPAKPACPFTGLPLMVGNTWTYVSAAGPNKLTDAQQRLVPVQPKKIVVTVDTIDNANGVATVHLTEKTDTRSLATTIVCGPGKFDASPDSIFFTGEPGGWLGMTISDVTHVKTNGASGTGWVVANNKFSDAEWHDDITANWAQTPAPGTTAKLQSGRIEVERRWVPQAPESVAVPAGNYNDATKIMVEVTGRVYLSTAKPDDKPYALAQGLVSSMWFVDGVGLMEFSNAFNHMYLLSEYKLAK